MFKPCSSCQDCLVAWNIFFCSHVLKMMVESDYIWLIFFRWVETIQKMFGNFTVQTVDPILWQDAEIDPSAGWSYGMAFFFHTPSGRTWYAVLNRWFLGELHDFGGSWSVWCVEVYRAGIPWALLDSIHLCMVHDSEICLWSALHEMHSVVPIRYGSKSIPPKMDWLPFLWIVLYPILTHTQFDFYLVQSGSLRLWGGGKTSS